MAGKRYGKGSSRESSPLAELSAGIRLIVAESFERIYQQNCDNIGILTTTDFTVLDRVLAGEAIPIEAFLTGRDALTQQVIRAGGLLAYSRAASWPAAGAGTEATQAAEATGNAAPRTLVEKSSPAICCLARRAPSAARVCSWRRTGASRTITSPACART